MKKIYTLVAGFLLMGTFASNAQDTLIYESFNFQSFYDQLIDDVIPPPGNTTDALWYSYDQDALADGSGGSRPGGWFAVQPFAYTDTLNNVAIAANSWFGAPAAAANWLVTPSVQLGPADTLFWKSAPRQTPRYCDGYKVKISTTTNDDLAFTTTLAAGTAAEMTSILGTNDSIFAGYGFSSGFVHGQDGLYTINQNDSARLIGVLRPRSIPLNAYANMKVYIAFFQDSFDDNLISLDDVMIRGVLPSGIKENDLSMNLSIFPNPATDMAQVNYTLSAEENVTINVYDIAGQVISTEVKVAQAQGQHYTAINTGAMAKGFYTVSVITNNGKSTSKLIVR